jgi:hypothetical protein
MSTLGKKMPNRKSPATPRTPNPTHRANGMGSGPITMSVTPDLREAIEARASRCGESRSAYLRRLVLADLREAGVTV